MSTFNDEMSLKLAWQTAYELRTCPDEDTLYSEHIDANLQKHLSICHACREKRAVDPEERKAWKTLQAKFAGETIQPATDTVKQAGQVWMLAKSSGGWRDGGQFINPPSVLLLDKIPHASWKVAQLYHDKRLMGVGDVLLNGRFGFAEGWNCYSLKEGRLESCLGIVKSEELETAAAASKSIFNAPPEESFLSFFRMMESEVGEFMAATTVIKPAEEMIAAPEKTIELIPGISLIMNGARDFVLDIAAETLGLLRGSFRPVLVLRGSAAPPKSQKLTNEQQIVLQDQCPVVPVGLNIADSVITIKLKWFQQKPLDMSTISLVVNGLELQNVAVRDAGKDATVITCSHEVIAEAGSQQLRNMRVIENAERIKIELEY